MLKTILYNLGLALYFIFPSYLFKKSFNFFRWVYSGYQSKKIRKCGVYFHIHSNSTIIGGEYMNIGNYVSIGKRVVLSAWNSFEYIPQVFIGDNTIIGDDCHITAINKVIIGSNVLMGKKITISDNSHGKNILEEISVPPIKRDLYSKGPVEIKDRVWIGDKVTILPGVSIGENSIIGANSVVTKNIPKNCVAAGVPAKVINIMK